MADLNARGPSGSSLYESTSNELEISSSDESLKKKVLVVLTVFLLNKFKVVLHY